MDPPFARMPRKFGRSSSAASKSSPDVSHPQFGHRDRQDLPFRGQEVGGGPSTLSSPDQLEMSPGGRASSLSISSFNGSESSSSTSLLCVYSGGSSEQPEPAQQQLLQPPSTLNGLLSSPAEEAGGNKQGAASGQCLSRASRQDLHNHLWPLEERHRRGNNKSPPLQSQTSSSTPGPVGVPLRPSLGPNVKQQNMGAFGSLVSPATPLSPPPLPPLSGSEADGMGVSPAVEVQHLCQLSKPLPTEPIRRVDLAFSRNPLDKALRFHRGTECYIKKIPQAVVAPFRRHPPDLPATIPPPSVTPIHRAAIAAASAAATAANLDHIVSTGQPSTTSIPGATGQPTTGAVVVAAEAMHPPGEPLASFEVPGAGCSSSSSSSPPHKVATTEASPTAPVSKLQPIAEDSMSLAVSAEAKNEKPRRRTASSGKKLPPSSALSSVLPPSVEPGGKYSRSKTPAEVEAVGTADIRSTSKSKRSLRQVKQKQDMISLPGGQDQQILLSKLTSCQVEVLRLKDDSGSKVQQPAAAKFSSRRKSCSGAANVEQASDCTGTSSIDIPRLSTAVLEENLVSTCSKTASGAADPRVEASAELTVKEPEPAPLAQCPTNHHSPSSSASVADAESKATPVKKPAVPKLGSITSLVATSRLEASPTDGKQQLAAKKRKRRSNKTGFPSTKAKKKKWHNEISSQVEGAGLKTSEEMPLISDTSEPLAPLAVSDKSTPDGPETENDALTSLPLPVTPVLPPQEKLQLKRVIEPIRSAARGRPAKRARGRPMVRSRDGPAAQATAALPAVNSSNNSSSIEPSPASSDVESLDYRWVLECYKSRVADQVPEL